MVFNVTLNTVSVISWRSVLLVEENRVQGENQTHKELIHYTSRVGQAIHGMRSKYLHYLL